MSVEEWRPIDLVPGYEISNQGRVRCLKPYAGHSGPRLRRAVLGNRGYLVVTLAGPNGQRVTRAIHSLVALAFIGPRPSGNDVRHLDGDRFNNTLANLAYGTRADNELDKVRHGRHHMARRTHCKNGHEFNEDNAVIEMSKGRPFRRCLECARERYRARATRRALADQAVA